MPMRPVVVGEPVADARRGEIYEVNLDPAKGREQKGLRPCLVISADGINKSGFGIAIVCPLTTKHKASHAWRTQLMIDDIEIVDAAWKFATCYVQTDQLLTLDAEEGRFRRHLCTVKNKRKLGEVATWICRMVGP